MADKQDRFEGDFIESSDLMHCPPVTVTVMNVVAPNTEKAADGRVIDKPIIAFEPPAQKRLIINRTNQKILKSMFGPRPADWIGQQVTLCVTYLKQAFGESNVPTVRVLPPPEIPMPFGVRKHYGSPKPHDIPGVSSQQRKAAAKNQQEGDEIAF